MLPLTEITEALMRVYFGVVVYTVLLSLSTPVTSISFIRALILMGMSNS